jgi:hypothetical protein
MPTRTGRLSAHLLVVLVYVALAVIMHWPLVMHLDTHVAGPWLSDNFEALWHLDRAASAIYDRPTGLLFDPHVYYPKGWHLASAALSPWFAASVAPLTHLVGPVASLNLTYLGLLVVAATGAYSMAYRRSGGRSDLYDGACADAASPWSRASAGWGSGASVPFCLFRPVPGKPNA